MKNPKIYLNEKPKIPNHYRAMLLGPPLCGKTTIGKELSENYNFDYLEVTDIVKVQ